MWCCVRFLVLAGNSFGVTYVLSVQYGCAVVSVFLVMAGNNSQNENMFLQKNLIGLHYYDLLADVCIS